MLLVRERREPLRCAVCHDSLGWRAFACAGCGTRLHRDCRSARCPSLGCDGRSRGRIFPSEAVAPLVALATAILGAAVLALDGPWWPCALLHFVVAPALLAGKTAGHLVAVQMLLVPSLIFALSAFAVALLPLLHSEGPAGLVSALVFSLEPALAVAWTRSSRPFFEG